MGGKIVNQFIEISKTETNRMFIKYISYLFSAALGLLDEPSEYGPMRLLSASEKLLETLGKVDLECEYFNQLLDDICENKELLFQDKNALKNFLEDKSRELVKKSSEMK